jgi:antitoxin ParD1/3/4
MRAFIDEQISADGYGTASEYVRNLIRADQKRLEEQKLEKLLLERLKSGNEKEFNVEDVRAKLSKRVRAKKK